MKCPLLKLYKQYFKDVAYEINLHLNYWFMKRRGLHIFPYISLCKKKFFGGFYFYAQTLQSISNVCCVSNRVFGLPVHEKKIFKNSPNFTPFCPLLGPNSCLNFANLNPHSPKMLNSYQIWFKSVQWF